MKNYGGTLRSKILRVFQQDIKPLHVWEVIGRVDLQGKSEKALMKACAALCKKGKLKRMERGIYVLSSSFNANPLSVEEALIEAKKSEVVKSQYYMQHIELLTKRDPISLKNLLVDIKDLLDECEDIRLGRQFEPGQDEFLTIGVVRWKKNNRGENK